MTFRAAFLSLLTPVIIVGGILAGLFTPTEAAIAACAYALFLGGVVYRTLNLAPDQGNFGSTRSKRPRSCC